eukprot:jgi/Hompol1/1024/HPOL_005490-RA
MSHTHRRLGEQAELIEEERRVAEQASSQDSANLLEKAPDNDLSDRLAGFTDPLTLSRGGPPRLKDIENQSVETLLARDSLTGKKMVLVPADGGILKIPPEIRASAEYLHKIDKLPKDYVGSETRPHSERWNLPNEAWPRASDLPATGPGSGSPFEASKDL